jgi:signal transduction histidine kinase
MIDTVVRNLFSNAIKFSESGGVVRISSSSITGQDDKICITVEDNGLGMDKKTLNRLFRITQQKSKKGTQGEQGSGLGLIICREFVEKNEGRIWAESALYEYTKFHFTLKLHDNNKKPNHPVESGSVLQVQ